MFVCLCQNGDQQQANICIQTGLSEQPQTPIPVSKKEGLSYYLSHFVNRMDQWRSANRTLATSTTKKDKGCYWVET